jgi:Flp pilus assembly protein TadB
MMEQTPRTGFNLLLMVEAVIAICVVLAGVVWGWSSLERRVAALEEARQRDEQARSASKREERIDRMEESLRNIQQQLPKKP